MLSNYRSLQFEIPLWTSSYPGRVDVALVHRNLNYPPSSPQLELFEFHEVEKIERNATDGVCRAWTGPRDDPLSQSFVIKFAIAGSDKRHESLGREATIYSDHLQSLQGVDVPKFFGLFEGEELESMETTKVTCIILEDCGNDLDDFFASLPLADRAEFLKKIGHIHKCGVTILDDFAERNVVKKDGKYRIIDFQHVETGHKCLWKSGLLYEGEVVPMMDDIGCLEMLNIGLELGLWKSRHSVRIYGKNVPKTEFPTQEAIDILVSGLHTFHFENEKRLHNWIKNYKKYEKTMTAQQYMAQFPRPAVERRPRDLEKDEYA